MSYGVNRREMLRKMMAGGLGAATAPWVASLAEAAEERAAHMHAAAPAAAPAADWMPKAMNAHQNEMVIQLSELIIPQTDTPGAKAALVNRFVDGVLDDADPRDKKEFFRGLTWVDERSRDLFGADFLATSPEQQNALLTIMSSGKNKSLMDQIGVDFFQSIKSMTITGYYTSEIGLRQELGDDGQLFFAEFKGCTHPEHGGPAPAPKGKPAKPTKKA
ncbi:MAG TPA: gluconate 2-dehydrogenase subunit 3 family protein [Vicinamibacteria bacterium]|nr:gluconate 2-dehydrogenase subunit 3 family protein [Vicinamibacteria bacterium]